MQRGGHGLGQFVGLVGDLRRHQPGAHANGGQHQERHQGQRELAFEMQAALQHLAHFKQQDGEQDAGEDQQQRVGGEPDPGQRQEKQHADAITERGTVEKFAVRPGWRMVVGVAHLIKIGKLII